MKNKWIWGVAGFGFIIFATVVYFSISLLFKKPDVYQLALEKVKTYDVFNQEIGTPLREGSFLGWSGSYSTSKSSGEADMAIDFSGPTADGTLYLTAEKRLGIWRFNDFFLEVGSKRFNLLDRLEN